MLVGGGVRGWEKPGGGGGEGGGSGGEVCGLRPVLGLAAFQASRASTGPALPSLTASSLF